MSDIKLTTKSIVSEEEKEFSPIRAVTTAPYEIITQAPIPVPPSEEPDTVLSPQPIPPEPEIEPGPTGPQGFQGVPGAGEAETWVNPTPTLATNLEGIPQGTTFPIGTSSIQILENLLYPYQSVGFNTFSVGIGVGPYEVGQTAGNGTFLSSWTISGPTGNWIPNSLEISGDSGVGLLKSGLNFDSSPTAVAHGAYRFSERKVLTFTIQGQQNQGANPSRSQSLNWRFRYFFGKKNEIGYTGVDLENQGFSTTLTRTSPINWQITFPSTFPTPTKAYVAIPKNDFPVSGAGSNGNIRFIDVSTNFLWPFLQPRLEFVHSNIHGITSAYFLFESSNEFADALTVRVEGIP
jgi:hypothetical protein